MTQRELSSLNQAEVDGAHVELVILVHIASDLPVFAHSGLGLITHDGNTYLGVGHLGSIGTVVDTEDLTPAPVQLTLTGLAPNLLSAALNSGSFGDEVSVHVGYRADDATLVDDPWLLWRGTYEYATLSPSDSIDGTSTITIQCQHELAVLDEIAGDRFTDEDQQAKYTGDTGFEFIHEMKNLKLRWGDTTVTGGGLNTDPRPAPRNQPGEELR